MNIADQLFTIFQLPSRSKEKDMTETKEPEKDGTVVLSLKATIEELVAYLGDMEISGAAFFIGVDNKTGRLFTSLARVDVPAGKDMKKSASIRMYDSDYLMSHEEVEMLNYRGAEIYLGHDEGDIVVRVRDNEKKEEDDVQV